MATLKRRTALAITAAVWITAIATAAGLAHALNRPIDSPAPLVQLAPREPIQERLVDDSSSSAPILTIPPVTIVAHTHRRAASPAPVRPRDIAEMRCAEWRTLDMGSGHVQVCE
jgi:hypothetical protein